MTKLVTPLLAEHMEQRVEDALAEQSDQVQMPEADVDDGNDLLDLLSLIGLDGDVRENLVGDIQDAVARYRRVCCHRRGGEPDQDVHLRDAVPPLLCGPADRAENRHRAGSGFEAAGAPRIQYAGRRGHRPCGGALVLFLAVWVLRRLGMSFETGPAAQTILFQFFTTHTPLDVLSLLQ